MWKQRLADFSPRQDVRSYNFLCFSLNPKFREKRKKKISLKKVVKFQFSACLMGNIFITYTYFYFNFSLLFFKHSLIKMGLTKWFITLLIFFLNCVLLIGSESNIFRVMLFALVIILDLVKSREISQSPFLYKKEPGLI